MWLLADIGGTNARFALSDGPGSTPRDITVLPTGDYPGVVEAVGHYLNDHGHATVEAACVAVAGPVYPERAGLTNSHWDFHIRDTEAALGLKKLGVINDFHALAQSLPSLPKHELVAIGGGEARADQALSVIGPGTGLGVGTLLPVQERQGLRWVAIPGEGGHVSLPAQDPEELAAMQHLQQEQGIVTAECFLCGTGIVRLYRAHAMVRGHEVIYESPQEIVSQALQGMDSLCIRTLEMFCAMLGNVAANAALTTGAQGGVFLGGGILPRIQQFFEASHFRKRFDSNVRMSDYLQDIPVHLILSETPALYGAQAWLEDWTMYGE